MQPNPELLKRLTGMFLVEAREHAESLGTGLLELEKAATREAQLPLVEKLFRAAHSLKGAARTVNAGEIERTCHRLEGVFSELKSGKRELAAPVLDGLHKDVAVLGKLIDAVETGPAAAAASAAQPTQTANPNPPAPAPAPAPAPVPNRQSPIGNRQSEIPPPPAAVRNEDTVRIAISKLDAIFVQAEELLGVKLAQAEHAAEFKNLAGLVAERDRLWAESLPAVRALRQKLETGKDAALREARGAAGSLPELSARVLELLDRDRELAEEVSTRITDFADNLAGDRRRFDTLVDRLLEDAKKALMLPFATILAGFPKMVRDLAHDAGKEIQFTLHGTETEIDKRILEQIKDPLVHLVRNAIDHGIEPPAERARRRKALFGTITLAISQSGGKVEIQIADDGAGIDLTAVRTAAIQAGAMSAGEAAALKDDEIRQLVFRSGVSTNRQVTEISGRGLGMAIVQEHAIKLGGSVTLESAPGAGTTVRIFLPLTLATLRGTLVRAAQREFGEFVIPTVNVVRVLRLKRAEVRRVENRDSISVDGMTFSLVRLAEVLGLGTTTENRAESLTILLLRHGSSSLAFAVEQVLGEQEVLAKPLGRLLRRVRNLAGATVLGTGRVVPILSVPDLFQSAIGCTETATGGESAEAGSAKRLLVADDSITTRTMLQSILETAGFTVQTAPNGAAALNLLQSESFDLVVSDVEMPRMDGFELTKRIRAEAKLAQLPVILVTAREAAEDRERGLDAGANAYLVKSGFDQSNLLETVRSLL